MKKSILTLILVLINQFVGFAQISPKLANESPYSVVYNQLYYLQPDSYEPNRAALSIPHSEADPVSKAIKIKEYLDGKGFYIDLTKVPSAANYVDSLTGKSVYQLVTHEPLILVEKVGDDWFYAKSTCHAIDHLHRTVYPFGTKWSAHFNTPFWQFRLANLEIWKWFGLLLIILLSWLLYRIIQLISQKFIYNFLQKYFRDRTSSLKHQLQLSRLIGLIIVSRMISMLIPALKINPWLNSFLLKGLTIASILLIILLIRQLIKLSIVFLERLTKKTESTLDDQLLPVLEKLAMIVLWGVGIIYLLDYLDVNITAMIAGISVGGLALALAAQDTVKNFFGSMVIFLDRPFQIGDWIQFEGVDGTVEEVGVRSTRVRTFANSLTYIPNAKLADSVVNNMGLRRYRRYSTKIGVTYDTPPDLIDEFVLGIREIIRVHPLTRKDYFEVHLNELGASSINVLIYLFFEVSTWSDELRCRHELIYAIMKLASSLGIRFAFPTQTIHVEEFPIQGQSNIHVPPIPTKPNETRESVIRDIKAYFASDKSDQERFKPIGGE